MQAGESVGTVSAAENPPPSKPRCRTADNNKIQKNSKTSKSSTSSNNRLSICDLLFCICSLSFHLLAVFSLLFAAFRLKAFDFYISFYVIISTLLFSSFVVVVVSFVWYLKNAGGGSTFRRSFLFDLGLHVTVHILQLTIIWRHWLLIFRSSTIRGECARKLLFCELIILRLIHTVVLCLPSCLILFYLLFRFSDDENYSGIRGTILTASTLNLLDFCFSLSAYNRKTNRRNVDWVVLCWPGVIAQFAWRLGTVGARCVTLAAYASEFLYFTSIVVALHWILMCLALFMFTTSNNYSGRRTTQIEDQQENGVDGRISIKWVLKCFLLGAIYVICFFNPTKGENAVWRFAAYYVVMLAENSLLLIIWLSLSAPSAYWIRPFVLGFGWGGFGFGVMMMCVYYKYFHVTKMMTDDDKLQQQPQRENCRPAAAAVMFACRLQPQIFQNRLSADRGGGSGEPAGGGANIMTRNGPRSRSVPNVQRGRRGAEEEEPENSETPRKSKKSSSRSLLRRRGGGRNSTFIETIF